VKAAGTFEVTGVSTLTGAVTAPGGVVGDLTGDVTGNADTATKAYVTDNESTDEENLIAFVAGAATASGNHSLEMDGNLAYNPSTGTITSTAIASNLTGNVTGNVTGDLTGEVTATGTLADGVTATTQAFADDSTKVATTAYTRLVMPSGAIVMWYTATAPDGWLVCDGSTFSAVTYPDLNTVLGGTTLPDLKGRVAVGVDDSAGRVTSDNTLGDSSGAEDVTLTGAQSGTSAHSHGIRFLDFAQSGSYTAVGGGDYSTGGSSTDASTEAVASSAHINLQPYLVVNYIIKT
jgi:microcystin-dependent protein